MSSYPAKLLYHFWIIFSLLISLPACDEESEQGVDGGMIQSADSEMMAPTPSDPLEIIGTYQDAYEIVHTISAESWSQVSADGTYSFSISTYDNSEMWLVAQNSEENEFSAGLWSRFDWRQEGEQLWYCQTRFDAVSEEEAINNESANGDDLEGEGCNGFPWSALSPQ